ncbi:uncharacterized protein ARMOST_07622 [Armillaria ostoyae]|uniref:Uncharacterized protein n=1 Tax=Armillaria ostoyae TaxID=47428 RepID=A0A284R6B4_ARMOS|nr:uncharacterized protein ARMOST_07622 [Armillaria ostoyae]
MPEVRELFFFYWVIKDFIQYSHRKSLPLDVLQLWIDAKEEEEDGTIALPKHAAKMAKQGMVFPLTKSMAHLTRGDKSVTTIYPSSHVVPSLHRPLEDNETENDICRTAGLILQDVIKHPRLVCLDLKEIQVLAHCSPNIYTINDWFETIHKVDKKTRKFKVVLAFQFKNHVLAFCSYDNNVRFYWFPSCASGDEFLALTVHASRQSAEDGIRDRGEDYTDDLLFDGDFFEFTDPLVNFHGWLEKLVAGLETRRLRKLAESKRRRQEKLNQKLHGSGSKPKAGAKIEEDLEIEEMQKKQKKVTEDKAVEKSKSTPKKEAKKKETKPTKQKVGTKDKKKTVVNQGNKVDRYLLRSSSAATSTAVQGKRNTPPEQEPVAPKPKRTRTKASDKVIVTAKAKSASSAAIRSSQPIVAFLRRADSPFAGIGAYSSGIILHNSGIPPLTKAEDVLNSPGRLARLIEVYVHFLSYMETAEDAKQILRHSRLRHRLTINATEAEKMEYYESLSIHGRSKCYVSDRHASLIKAYNSANGPLATPFSGPKYYDPFEPAYIADTLSKRGHLGHLIFGEDMWKAMRPATLAGEEYGLDPLSRYFDFLQQKKVNLLESKYLDLKCYNNTLVVPLKERHLTPHVYRYNSIYKQIWSVLDIPSLEKYEGGDHNDRLLTIIKTTSDGWTVGPLDFCAVSLYVHVNGKEQLAICRGDPQRLTPHDIQFVKRGIEIRKESEHYGHNSKTPTKVQSKWKEAEDATEQIEEAWYARRRSLRETELADVAEEQAWHFADEERRRGLVGGKRQRRLKGIRLSEDATPVIPQRRVYPSINEALAALRRWGEKNKDEDGIFLDDNVVALTPDIQQARPIEHTANADHDDARPEDGEQAEAEDDEVDGEEVDGGEETANGLEKRISALYPSFDEDPLKARHFRDSGYEDDTASWADKLKCLVDERTSWDALCDRGLINVQIPELLLGQGKAGRSELWVSAVIRMVEMIRFNKLWKKHDNGPGSRKWKGKFLRAACRDDNEELYRRMDGAVGAYKKQLQVEVKERYSQFRRQLQRVIKAREPLVALYNQFGAAVFMDRAWDCENGIQRHSGGFSKLVDRLCEVEYNLKEKRKHNEASLKEALKVLTSEKVVSYVGAFLVAYPCE